MALPAFLHPSVLPSPFMPGAFIICMKSPMKRYLNTLSHICLNKKEVKMAKITAWVVTIIGVLLLLPLMGLDIGELLNSWLIVIGVLVIGISKLIRNYSYKKKR